MPVPQDVRSPGALLIGRSGEVAELRAAIDALPLGPGRLFLISGDLGIGKTKLAEEIGAYAHTSGAAEVLWGRCDETGGAPAYWIWIQVLRASLADQTADDLASAMASGAAAIAQVVPEVIDRLPHLPSPPPLEPDQARFRFFDSVATYLKNLGQRQPLLLVFDDLHAADKPSLLLLRFFARSLAQTRVAILGTYRDAETGREHPLCQMLADLGREPMSRRVPLSGLTQADVARCIELTAGVPAPARLVDTVFRQTDGNPLFVTEVVQWLVSSGQLAADGTSSMTIPPSMREVVALRLDGLSEDCKTVLSHAAVIGREFPVPVLQRLVEVPRAGLLALLDEAIAARLVIEMPESVGLYSFRHGLIQEAIYREIATARRAQIHLRIGEALDAFHAGGSGSHLAQMAHHFFAAAPAGDATRAVEYAARAADHAAGVMAHEEAVRHYEMALAALELSDAASAERRCDLLLRLGETLWRCGEVARAKATCLQAAELASAIPAADQLARAALVFAGRLPAFGAVLCDPHVVEVLERALSALGNVDSSLRAEVLARLGEELMFSEADERMRSVSRQAVEMARGGGDPRVLGSVLKSTHFPLWVPEAIEQRLSVGSEIVQLGGGLSDRTLAFEGRLFRLTSLVELGRLESAHDEFRTCEQLARELRQPYYDWLLASTRTLLAVAGGRLRDVPGLADNAFARGEEAQHAGARLFLGVQRCHLRWLQGQFAGIAPALLGFADTYPVMARSLSCALAAEYAEEEREAEARAVFERIASNGFSGVSRTLTWVSNIALLSEACAFLRDVRRAEQLYELLLPFAQRNVVLSLSIALGSGSHFLGRLAATMGRWDDACRHFEDALRMNAEFGTVQWCARSQLAYAEMLCERGDPDDRDLVARLLGACMATAGQLEMSALTDKARAVQSRVAAIYAPGSAAVDDERAESSRPQERAARRASVFRREGEYWTIVYNDRVCRFKDAKGFHYLAYLLRSPGQQFYAADLLACVDPPPPLPLRAVDRSSSAQRITADIAGLGPTLDAAAKRQYKRRLAEVQEELDEAERFNDPGRAERARAESDAILAQLGSALGLRGRARQAGSSAERARLTVTKGIKAVLRKLEGEHPALGRYLASHIKTGALCVYRVDPDQPIFWEE